MKLPEDLREFIGLLTSHEVEFLVMGGHAVAFHGYPRFTGDIDFFVNPKPENARRVAACLRAFGFHDAAAIEVELAQPGKLVQLGVPPFRIDLLTSVSGLSFEEAARESIPGQIDGLPARFPSKQALLANKRASGRSKDLLDVEELEKR
ncbi:MAG: nucleotidyltransferase family protein [Thermoanaerobaculia bacterium]|nr:nucleotidyltransferase family protein [Thermoanaerobaculia bacterium]